MIICNGFPKSGTNLLMKTVALFGVESASILIAGNKPYADLKYSRLTFNCDTGCWSKEKLSWSHCDKLTNFYFVHGHINSTANYQHILDNGHKIITIYREPKNSLISWCRWRCKENGKQWVWDDPNKREKYIIDNIKQNKIEEKLQLTYPQLFYSWYADWKTKQSVLKIDFDDLFTLPGLTRIQNFLQTEIHPKTVLPNLLQPEHGLDRIGTRSTWSGKHSDYNEFWSDKIESVWNQSL